MNKIIIVTLSLVLIGGVSLASAYEELGSGLMKKCDESSLGWQGWSHLQGWCSVIDSQQKIIEQNDEIIKQLKIANCMDMDKGQPVAVIENCESLGITFKGGDWIDE